MQFACYCKQHNNTQNIKNKNNNNNIYIFKNTHPHSNTYIPNIHTHLPLLLTKGLYVFIITITAARLKRMACVQSGKMAVVYRCDMGVVGMLLSLMPAGCNKYMCL